jgi:hypothetical protein
LLGRYIIRKKNLGEVGLREPGEVAEFGVGVDEDILLIVRGFSRINSRVYMEILG